MTIVLIIAAAVTVLGGGLMLVGWRGRRVGDHPVCRRCGFDLFGKPAESRRCPECGADLDARRAVATGIRTMRPWALMAGAALLIPGVAVTSLIGWGIARGIAWEPHQPTWWLARQAQSRDAVPRDAALAELVTRFQAGTLSDRQITDLVERGLAMQAQPDRPWAFAWGDLIEQARATNQVSDAQWERYARQSVAGMYSVRVRPALRAGDPIIHAISRAPARVGRSSPLYAMSSTNIVIDGVAVTSSELMSDAINLDSRQKQLATAKPELDRVSVLKPGSCQGYLRVRLQLGDGAPARPNYERWFRASRDRDPDRKALMEEIAAHRKALRERVFTETEIRVPFQLELLPPDQPLARAVGDEKLRPTIEAALKVDRVELLSSGALIIMTCASPPVDLCFDLSLREGDREWPAQRVAFQRGQDDTRFLMCLFKETDGPTTSAVDVVLRPSDDAAALLLNGDVRYFNGEIVIKRVPLAGRSRPDG